MKTITTALKTFLESGVPFIKADMLQLDLVNGQSIYAVMGAGADIVWNGNIYSAAGYGVWERGPITSVADFSLESQTTKLTVVAGTDIAIPGTTAELMSVVTGGFFDATKVHISTIYLPAGQWGASNIKGSLKLFEGIITNGQKVGRSKAEFEVHDWMYLLNLKVPMRVIQPSCFQTLFDDGCTLVASSYGISRSVASGSTQTVITPSTNWPTTDPNGNNPQANGPDGYPYFNQGKLQFTSGENLNLWGSIQSSVVGAAGALTLALPMPFPVAAGDTFVAYPGCSKQLLTCKSKFANQVHFTGEPFTPPPETSA